MNLKELKQHIENLPSGSKTEYSLSEPFSWRGIYAEVAFAIENTPSTKEELLANVEKAYNETFTGYKGGDYTYNDYTDVHFEEDTSCYTDGRYTMSKIAEIEKTDSYQSIEHKLINLAFPKP